MVITSFNGGDPKVTHPAFSRMSDLETPNALSDFVEARQGIWSVSALELMNKLR